MMYADDSSDLMVNFSTFGVGGILTGREGVPWRTSGVSPLSPLLQLIIPGVPMPATTEANWKLGAQMSYKNLSQRLMARFSSMHLILTLSIALGPTLPIAYKTKDIVGTVIRQQPT